MVNPTIHVVSTGTQTLETFSEIASSIHVYVDFIHIREKARTAGEIAECVSLLVEKGVPTEKLIINDRVDVAAVLETRGVQLAFHSLGVPEVKRTFPNMLVGKSVHSIEEALVAEQQGADYVLFGHIFATTSKPDLYPRGVSQLKQLINQVTIPVIAIGGISPDNVGEVIEAGVSGVAVMSGILQAEDPVAEVKKYRKRIEEVQHANTL
ncbi:thiazole tautomerase TenI [Pseudalkalibacillus sp. Hm43]|uniref:thiazole tautomerase TenI n=1 Tax=Pseudalkalibacillus sp. Hm43 TaxID=3450742 RepID=UPI003F4308B1